MVTASDVQLRPWTLVSTKGSQHATEALTAGRDVVFATLDLRTHLIPAADVLQFSLETRVEDGGELYRRTYNDIVHDAEYAGKVQNVRDKLAVYMDKLRALGVTDDFGTTLPWKLADLDDARNKVLERADCGAEATQNYFTSVSNLA